MSQLARSFSKTQIAALPLELPLPEDDQHDDSSSASSMSSTGTVRPTSSQKVAPPSPPSQWSDYFAQELYLDQESASGHAQYHVYITPPRTASGVLVVVHHGAGSSALSFALFVLEMRRLMPDIGILAVEARGHGSVVRNASGEISGDFSLTHLSDDLAHMVYLTQVKLNWPSLPPLILVGHSLGGAVVTDAAMKRHFGDKLLGFAVLDVVEGSALEALKMMQAYLSSRPTSFPTIDAAIDWHIRSRTLRNPQSARASVPPLFHKTISGLWAWRTELAETETYWEDWFGGMSSKFLDARGAKLLLLAGTDRLDKELMIGQMQGKFQLSVFPGAGHFLQEDLPERTAEVVAEFIRRNDHSNMVLPPKVSDLLKQGKEL